MTGKLTSADSVHTKITDTIDFKTLTQDTLAEALAQQTPVHVEFPAMLLKVQHNEDGTYGIEVVSKTINNSKHYPEMMADGVMQTATSFAIHAIRNGLALLKMAEQKSLRFGKN